MCQPPQRQLANLFNTYYLAIYYLIYFQSTTYLLLHLTTLPRVIFLHNILLIQLTTLVHTTARKHTSHHAHMPYIPQLFLVHSKWLHKLTTSPPRLAIWEGVLIPGFPNNWRGLAFALHMYFHAWHLHFTCIFTHQIHSSHRSMPTAVTIDYYCLHLTILYKCIPSSTNTNLMRTTSMLRLACFIDDCSAASDVSHYLSPTKLINIVNNSHSNPHGAL
jgi:hypothetical protein